MDPQADTPNEPSDLDAEAQSLVEEMGAIASEEEALAEEVESEDLVSLLEATSEPSASDEPADLVSNVQDLLNEVEALAAESEGTVATEETITDLADGAETLQDLASLDAELAGLADDLIAGEFADEEDAITATTDEITPTQIDRPETPPKDQPEAPPMNRPEAPPTGTIEVSDPEPPSRPAPAAPSAAATPAPATDASAAEKVVHWTRVVSQWVGLAARFSHRHAAPVLRRVIPAAQLGATVVSKPVAGRPAIVRDTIGWVALVTMFWAGCLWFYLLFIREPNVGPRPESSVRLVEPE